MNQYVDPEITKNKFLSEVSCFQDNEITLRKMGIICSSINLENFTFELIFSVPKLNPCPIGFASIIDYSNWDIEPPSIKLINPFTFKVLNLSEIVMPFLQWNKECNSPQPILVKNNEPFFCIPGVREYHNHWAHTGDSWFLHRNKGEGKICTIISQLYRHSTYLVNSYLLVPLQVNNMKYGIDLVKLKQ